MKQPWVQVAVQVYGWAQKGITPNGELQEESSAYIQLIAYLDGLKGEVEEAMLDNVNNKTE
jgi:hypothetical protein